MDNSRTTQRYRYIIRMIEQSQFNAHGLPQKFFDEDAENSHSLFFQIKKVCADEFKRSSELDNKFAFRILTTALSKYLLRYPATTAVRQRLYQHIFAWCESLGDQFRIPDYEMFLSDIPHPIDRDLAITLVKELHSQDGISKADLAKKCDLSEKTIQVGLHQLSGESHYQPLRLGGQAVVVPVSHKKAERRDDKRLYFTPNTLSPVVLQLNLMQVETLLKSLQLNYDSLGNNIPLDLAVDTWGQLSDYAKNRIRKVFCHRDPELAEFLRIVDDESQSEEYRFMTESEMMQHRDMSISEQLLVADKGSIICNLSLIAPHRTRKNQRIIYDHEVESYYAVPADDPTAEKLYFTVEEVYMVSEV